MAIPEAFFGDDEEPIDWRKFTTDEDDREDDEGPPSKCLVSMLGVNPDELDEI